MGCLLRNRPGFTGPRSSVLKAIATQYNRAHHAFAVFTACLTFLVIMAGASVTSNDAGTVRSGLADHLRYPFKGSAHGRRREIRVGHRMVAGSSSACAAIVGSWTWLRRTTPLVAQFGVAALGTVIVQADSRRYDGSHACILPRFRRAHAAVAQTFFCIAVCIAMFTGQKWVEEPPRVEFDTRRPSLFTLTCFPSSFCTCS